MSVQHASPAEAIERARELAREVALGAAQPEALERAHEGLPSRQVECWRAFKETFATLVREDEQRCSTWNTVLREKIKTAIADPKKLFLSSSKHEIRQFDAQVDGWKYELDPLAAWDRRCRGYVAFRGEYPFFHLHLLLCIDPAAWCVEVDTLPALDLMDGALFHYTHLKENPEQIEALLRLAPRVFEEDGRWASSRSVVALLLTHHLLHIDSSEVWLRDAFRVLLERPDGKYIAFAFLGHLAHKELIADQRFGGHKDEPERKAFKVLAELLATRFSVKDARDAWTAAEAVAKEKHKREKARRVLKENDGVPRMADDRGEGARTLRGQGLPLLFGTAVMLGENPAQAEAQAFWSWFEELLVGRDKGLSMARRDNGSTEQLIRRFGALLACLPDPEKAFRSIYRNLEPQRRRTTFSHRYEGHDDDIGSMLLLDIGPYAALYWCKRDANAGGEPLFWCGYEAARRLWLTSLQRFSKEKRKLVCSFFAFLPHIFGENLEEALQRALPPIANDASMVCSAGSLLFRNGVAPERLRPLIRQAGVDLEVALRDAYQWATLTENNSIPRSIDTQNEDFPRTFEDLVRALGMALSIEEIGEQSEGKSSKEPALTRQRRAFALGIAWGSRLLQRLDEERCTPRRLLSLDATGSMWLLQVALPPNVSKQLGISQEIRILAVHGDVRGRDLRMVMRDPEGDANVDPDLLVVASDQPELAKKLPWLAGSWGQRVPWSLAEDEYSYLTSALREHLPTFARGPKG
ncbi:hypothetical protein [Polyangium jinanense]|uniref:Uncharacterized protein n=1 Tax=Polyangium jinanense TaxID=2829994 RepID=A0A9X4AV22_9BACT|nr:hypothetical protein [Polyangium jinanense]MDC3959977.1 hypothetical protein [Polyangium jinanense]MDC3983857.1 hypothetical protein [Polyangium jinanense]